MHNEEERADEKKKKKALRAGGEIANGHSANDTKANPVMFRYKTRYFNLKASNTQL